MLIINGDNRFTEQPEIYELTYNMRDKNRKTIEMKFSYLDNPQLTYEMLASAFTDGCQITRYLTHTLTECVLQNPIPEGEEAPEDYEPIYIDIEREETKEFDLSEFCVAGDIIDKRDGTFVVYMGQKTEAEIKDEEMAELILAMGGME